MRRNRNRSVLLREGWNLISWTSDEQVVADATAGLVSDFTVFAWDVAAQQVDGFGPTRPPFLNSLGTLGEGAGLWVSSPAAQRWPQVAHRFPRSGASLPRGASFVLSSGREGWLR